MSWDTFDCSKLSSCNQLARWVSAPFFNLHDRPMFLQYTLTAAYDGFVMDEQE